jgi:hypothetical protein
MPATRQFNETCARCRKRVRNEVKVALQRRYFLKVEDFIKKIPPPFIFGRKLPVE